MTFWVIFLFTLIIEKLFYQKKTPKKIVVFCNENPITY